VTQFDDVTEMTSYLIFFKFYCITINLKATNWPITQLQITKTQKTRKYLTFIIPSRAYVTK